MTKRQIFFLTLTSVAYIANIFVAATAEANVVAGFPTMIWIAWIGNAVIFGLFLLAGKHDA